MKKLEILIPQYSENEEIIKPLLDSIEIQQRINLKEDIGVIIVNDGSNTILHNSLFEKYSFPIKYYLDKHRGVSGTRNACFDRATADYIMFCDADDMFYNPYAICLIFEEIERKEFDVLVSKFIEENIDDKIGRFFVPHDYDQTFVHGKIYRRQYLIDKNIRWQEELTVHEDYFFNSLAQKLTKRVRLLETPIYIWRHRPDSVCRRDEEYMIKTYKNVVASAEKLVQEYLSREREEDAIYTTVKTSYDVYFTLTSKSWQRDFCYKYKEELKQKFKIFWNNFNKLYYKMNENDRNDIFIAIKKDVILERQFLEAEPFEEWLQKYII